MKKYNPIMINDYQSIVGNAWELIFCFWILKSIRFSNTNKFMAVFNKCY